MIDIDSGYKFIFSKCKNTNNINNILIKDYLLQNGVMKLTRYVWLITNDNSEKAYFSPNKKNSSNNKTYIFGGGGVNDNGFIVYGSAANNDKNDQFI